MNASRISEKLVYLNSKNSYYNSEGDFSFQVSPPVKNVISLQLMKLNVCWCWLTIDSHNNTLCFNDGANRTITLDSGNYEAYDLVTALKAKMDAVNNGVVVYTWSFSDVTKKLPVSVVGANVTIKLQSSTCSNVIGLTGDLTIANNASGTLMKWVDPMSQVKELQVRLPGMINSSETKNNQFQTGDLLISISLSGYSAGDYIKVDNSESFEMKTNQNFLSTLVVSIVDSITGYTPEWYVDDNPFSITFKVRYYE